MKSEDVGALLVLVVFCGVIMFIGYSMGYGDGKDFASQTHCESLGQTYGKFDFETQKIVCWDEIPAIELEE